jgi:hypothetical protein
LITDARGASVTCGHIGGVVVGVGVGVVHRLARDGLWCDSGKNMDLGVIEVADYGGEMFFDLRFTVNVQHAC